MAQQPLPRAVLAEFFGTAMLLCAVIGSGIMAQRLSGGNTAVALLANTLATVFALYALIEVLGPVSGAHFNPVVTLAMAGLGLLPHRKPWAAATLYVTVQLAGAVAGAWLAHAMFDLQILQFSAKLRGGWDAAGHFSGWGQWLAEVVAAGGLVFVILGAPPGKAGGIVACYIGAAYWFTASTSFANPAAVAGRLFTDSFAGIAAASAPGFVIAQCIGGFAGMLMHRLIGQRSQPT